jgi:hypothetical protein
LPNVLKILIAPLDWGLGHCSRCIPIINYLASKGVAISIAGNKKQLAYFKEELSISPNYYELDGYNIRYGKQRLGTMLRIIAQIPKILRAIRQEQRWLQAHLKQHTYNAIISDNRYGFYSQSLYSIFITHQINIQAPYFEKLINHLNWKFIKRFNACWIPDFAPPHALAGALSKEAILPIPHTYLGALSRFRKAIPCNEANERVLLILSGVQPHINILRDKVIAACAAQNKHLSIVGNSDAYSTDNLTSYTVVSSEILQELIATHAYIISRNGYSTLMDLYYAQRKALLIPSPGQTEQEYLATLPIIKQMHVLQNQNELDLQTAFREIKKETLLQYQKPQLAEVLDEWLATLSK